MYGSKAHCESSNRKLNKDKYGAPSIASARDAVGERQVIKKKQIDGDARVTNIEGHAVHAHLTLLHRIASMPPRQQRAGHDGGARSPLMEIGGANTQNGTGGASRSEHIQP